MASPLSEYDALQHVSPVSAPSPQQSLPYPHDRDASAPEVVVDAATTPSTIVASPVTGNQDEGAKEVLAYDDAGKIAVPAAYEFQSSPPPQVIGVGGGGGGGGVPRQEEAERSTGPEDAAAPAPRPFKVLGLKRRTFWILLVVALLVIVAAAVGGGVGGALSSRKPKSTEDTAATSPTTTDSASTPSSTPPSSSSSSSTTTTPRPTPTFLNQTDTSSGHFFQGFSQPRMSGSHTGIVSAVGGADFSFDVRSYQFVARNTNCCLSFCRNATSEGWLGYLCESRTQSQAADAFSRVFVWCSDKRSDAYARGRCA
ncbi:hypothetical protein ISF_00194 [Cordyceps fumosorosea ARSEF 2679]|uniref:Uncharacterized protein n=1 Tax=Cordyceps fumosorosea (strain ARSEF 2679) TaxID=1081104 RepID=A0A168E2C7_CORFA|nr:hypothetical protein ISF_00194 [Cordyceps fumosorosea ARSEF 2679]OAA73293.1 hypothetical protein ISF_00194 [Cordyceps fumosorosea ARSEF 2679]